MTEAPRPAVGLPRAPLPPARPPRLVARPVVPDPSPPPGVDVTRPSPVRLYDYYLGGTNNFAVDRAAADEIAKFFPALTDAAWANRGFHQRAVRWLAAERGIRQFIDIGSGLPTVGNTHEVAARVDPAIRVVYVDVDPMVAAYSARLLAGSGSATIITADLRDPDTVLGHPGLRDLINFGEPAGLLMTAVLHFVADGSDPWGLVRRYRGALASGSYLALSHGTADRIPSRAVDRGRQVYERATETVHPRSKREIARFFEGTELVPPYPGAAADLTFAGEWGAEDPALADSDGSRVLYCGVARCP
jgi:S-adenosyl methyltransferase